MCSMRDLTRAAQALSDETRLRMLNLIIERECCVCEIVQALKISRTRASRNLKVLYDAGFLSMRDDGLFTLYSLNSENKVYYIDLVEAVKKSFEGGSIARSDLASLNRVKRIERRCIKEAVVS